MWSEADIVGMLATGLTPEGDRVEAPMMEVLRTASQLSVEDRAAMAAYIKSLPPIVSSAAKELVPKTSSTTPC